MEIVLKEISKKYTSGNGEPLLVLSKVSCTFPANRSISIQGQSGVGKSTLLYLLAGLDSLDSGEVWFGDVNVSQLSEDSLALFRRKHVGVVFQAHNLLPEFTACENVALPLILAGDDENEAIKKASQMLHRVGLKKREEHRPSMLSGGEQQRVAVARAIVSEPSVVLADEPTGNLDPETAHEIGALLLELQNEKNNTLIVVTHSEKLALSLEMSFKMGAEGKLEELTCLNGV